MSGATSTPVNKERNRPSMFVGKRYQVLKSRCTVSTTTVGVVG
jgi:hypothetical protein